MTNVTKIVSISYLVSNVLTDRTLLAVCALPRHAQGSQRDRLGQVQAGRVN